MKYILLTVRALITLLMLYYTVMVGIYAYYSNKMAENVFTPDFEKYQKKAKNIERLIPF